MSPKPSLRHSPRRAGNTMRWDAKTIAAVTGLAAVLLGGGEARIAMGRIEAKVDRLEERVLQLEFQGKVAQNGR